MPSLAYNNSFILRFFIIIYCLSFFVYAFQLLFVMYNVILTIVIPGYNKSGLYVVIWENLIIYRSDNFKNTVILNSLNDHLNDVSSESF